jgi:hypothetical protein
MRCPASSPRGPNRISGHQCYLILQSPRRGPWISYRTGSNPDSTRHNHPYTNSTSTIIWPAYSTCEHPPFPHPPSFELCPNIEHTSFPSLLLLARSLSHLCNPSFLPHHALHVQMLLSTVARIAHAEWRTGRCTIARSSVCRAQSRADKEGTQIPPGSPPRNLRQMPNFLPFSANVIKKLATVLDTLFYKLCSTRSSFVHMKSDMHNLNGSYCCTRSNCAC